MTPEPVKINHKTELEKKMFVKKTVKACNVIKISLELPIFLKSTDLS